MIKYFEKSMNELEALVLQLEKGDLSLEEALKQFEKGVKLTQTCQKTLNDAEQKVQRLSQQQTLVNLDDEQARDE